MHKTHSRRERMSEFLNEYGAIIASTLAFALSEAVAASKLESNSLTQLLIKGLKFFGKKDKKVKK